MDIAKEYCDLKNALEQNAKREKQVKRIELIIKLCAKLFWRLIFIALVAWFGWHRQFNEAFWFFGFWIASSLCDLNDTFEHIHKELSKQ